MKSRQMSSYLQPGPALILFTPRNPLWEHTDIYSMVSLYFTLFFGVVKNQFCSLERLVWNITIATMSGEYQTRKIGLKRVALETT